MNAPESKQLSAPALAMIRQLVSFDTTSRESNLALIDWVAGYLRDHGIASRLTFDDTRKKANLFATIGPSIDGGIVLSGHTDVVPVDGQPWTSDPWQATIAGDRLVGRGVCDMKSFIAIALALVPEMRSRSLARPLHFALSYDEEVGCIGVRRLIADLANLEYAPGGCIVGEPTGMELVVAHKGKRSYTCRVRGFEAHSALTPKGVNAVEIACEIVAYLRGMAKRFRDQGRHDDDYDVPFTTVHVGTIKGRDGAQHRAARLRVQVRVPPPAVRRCRCAVSGDHGLRRAVSARDARRRAGYGDHVRGALESSRLRHRRRQRHRGAGPMLQPWHRIQQGVLRRRGVAVPRCGDPSILCGPGHIAQAHQPNEWVTLEQVSQCEAFLRRLIDQVSAKAA
jgi:acetylornithine deacetylase